MCNKASATKLLELFACMYNLGIAAIFSCIHNMLAIIQQVLKYMCIRNASDTYILEGIPPHALM